MTAEQLERERRLGVYAAGAAIVAIVLTVASVAIQASFKSVAWHGHTIKPTTARTEAQLLILTHHQPGAYLALAIIGGLALGAIGVVLFYLYSATLARRPEVPNALRWVALFAPALSAIVGVINQIDQADAAKKFVHLPISQTLGKAGDTRATHIVRDTAGAVQYIGYAAGILLILAFVMTSIYAMRAGLLSRGLGFFGAAVGVLLLIPILGPATTFVQILWLAALAVLFLNRWPGGRGPAWEAGEAVPWPTPAQRRAGAEAGQAGGGAAKQPQPTPRPSGGELARSLRSASRGDGADGGGGAATAVSDADEEAPTESRPHPRSKKRKRKRR
jgi:hypothetical protein